MEEFETTAPDAPAMPSCSKCYWQCKCSDSPWVSEPLFSKLFSDRMVNPQSNSRLLRLSNELLAEIFRRALTGKTWHPIRDGGTCPLFGLSSLLLTCRRIYYMTFDLPFQLNPLVMDFGAIIGYNPFNVARPALSHLSQWQFSMLSSVEVHLSQDMLETPMFLENVAIKTAATARHEGKELDDPTCRRGNGRRDPGQLKKGYQVPVQKITSLTIWLCAKDWLAPLYDHTDKDFKLALDPAVRFGLRGFHPTSHKDMLFNARVRREGTEEPFKGISSQTDNFQNVIAKFPDLGTLTMKLETWEEKMEQLDSVVQCAKTWRFPLNDDDEMRWDEHEPECYSYIADEVERPIRGGDNVEWIGTPMKMEVRVVTWTRVTKTRNEKSDH